MSAHTLAELWDAWVEAGAITAGERPHAASGLAGRPIGVDVDPSSTDGITGRNGSIQGDPR